ncbi:MAG TPA: ATP-binding protein [Actinoplanes sp.]|nr:ATP-binding protein [Actinoplanes sp.]
MARWRRLRPAEAGSAVLVLLGTALFATAIFVVVVRGGGALIGRTDSPDLALSVLATAIVALGFQPVRRRLRPVAARLARGQRAAPYDVLTRFLDDIAGGYATDAVPQRMARLLVAATGARYAQVWLTVNDDLMLSATWPPDAGPATVPAEAVTGRHVLPVSYADERLGLLIVQECDRQPLTPVEAQLFAGLAAQAGLVLRSVRLRTELAVRVRESTEQARALRASRERIVAAQDEERRRLERDIHDGAQQHLVTLAVNLRLARTLVARSPHRAPAVLHGVKTAVDDTIDTLSALSRGIYPRTLADHGLAAALSGAAAGPLRVHVTVEGVDRMRSDLETALYFCALEALQNAAKHAGATAATVRVWRTAGGVELVVADDGVGFSPAAVGPGRGLANMTDRAESVGGRIRVDSAPGRGTVIAVHVPWAPAPVPRPAAGKGAG